MTLKKKQKNNKKPGATVFSCNVGTQWENWSMTAFQLLEIGSLTAFVSDLLNPI